jgi:hypothetical protein
MKKTPNTELQEQADSLYFTAESAESRRGTQRTRRNHKGKSFAEERVSLPRLLQLVFWEICQETTPGRRGFLRKGPPERGWAQPQQPQLSRSA